MARKAAAATAISEYLASLSPESRRALGRVRALIRATAPTAVESRSYGIIGYQVHGRPFISCGGFTQHVAIYPVTAAMRRDHADAIAPFQASKGTLKFPLDAPIPVTLIRRLLKTRLAEMRET